MNSSATFFRWTCQCWLTNKNLYVSTLYRHCMPLRGLANWSRRMVRELREFVQLACLDKEFVVNDMTPPPKKKLKKNKKTSNQSPMSLSVRFFGSYMKYFKLVWFFISNGICLRKKQIKRSHVMHFFFLFLLIKKKG